MIDIIFPKRPAGPGWSKMPPPAKWVTLGYSGESWLHAQNQLFVISAVEVAKDDDGIERGPEYHISISQPGGIRPGRCSSADALWVLAQFELDGAEEDNHVPNGVVRNFWRPVADRFVGLDCACKDAEPKMVLDKGDFIWRGVSK